MGNDDIINLGIRHGYGGEYPFFFTMDDRRHHTYVIGKTGVGKSTFLLNLIYQDIHAGRGVGVIDPHGTLAEEVLCSIPSWRAEDVVYFSPHDYDYPVAWNLLKIDSRKHKDFVVSSIVSAFKGIWKDFWGPRMENILEASVATLLECDNTSLLGISRLLGDAPYRHWVLKQIRDPGLRYFWQNEFGKKSGEFSEEAIAPVQNKVGKFLLSSSVRNIFGQVKSKVNARFMMDNRRIFIAKLAKGAIGEDKTELLGALLVTQFYQAAMARVDVPEEERVDFHLVIDEVQSFSTESFSQALAEVRKMRLSVTAGNQYIAQLSDSLKHAIFGNVGTFISFRVGAKDAEALATEFGYTYRPETFTDLSNHEICAKILQHGEEQEPFLGRTFAPNFTRYHRNEKVIKRSRERYTTPRAVMEEKFARWLRPTIVEKSRRKNGLRRKK
jgi:hypothetical protein